MLKLILNRDAGKTLGWIFLSLLITATSILWISGASGSSVGWFGQTTNIVLLMGSLVLASIPTILSETSATRAELQATKAYADKFVTRHSSSADLILDTTIREKHEALLTTQARMGIRSAQRVIFGSVQAVSSFIVDAALMTWVLDSPWVLAAYAGGASIYLGSYKLFGQPIEERSATETRDNTKFSNSLKIAWDNITIGNKHNFNIWNNRFLNSFNSLESSSVDHQRFVNIRSTIVTLLASVPIFATSVYLFQSNIDNAVKIALLVAIVPRQVQTVRYLEMVSKTLLQWRGAKANLKILEDSIEDSLDKLSKRAYNILWDKISFGIEHGSTFNSEDQQTIKPFLRDNGKVLVFNTIDLFLLTISKLSSGRITIRGDNQAGKTVLMCKLHTHLTRAGKESFYLPVTINLSFIAPVETMSSGIKRSAAVQEVLNDVPSQFILFDEWDANSDPDWIALSSAAINKASKNRCVIEIRHRMDRKQAAEQTFTNEAPSRLSQAVSTLTPAVKSENKEGARYITVLFSDASRVQSSDAIIDISNASPTSPLLGPEGGSQGSRSVRRPSFSGADQKSATPN